MAKQPNPDRTLTQFLRESQRKAQRAEAARPDVVLSAPEPATTAGAVVGRLEVFDASGVSLGFVALYSSIT